MAKNNKTPLSCAGLILCLAALLSGCDGSSGGSTVIPAGDPLPPALGAQQIDRMGRSAIATALVSVLADTGTRGMQRDAYNAAAIADWPSFQNDIRGNLAIYDGLDAVCGNQILADATVADASRYDALANVLVDDRLFLDTTSGLCNQYFGVELAVTGLVPNSDCGGRTPLQDTIDVSYTALSNDLSIPVGDGVAADTVAQSDMAFPFLAQPRIIPDPPALLANQLDRMGRSAIATALIAPLADAATRGPQRDAYNAAAQEDWQSFQEEIRNNLAIYDGLDANCGNQILADGAATDATRYDTLATVLADDRVFLDTSSGTCVQYFGVELQATGLVPNTDCGGRTPTEDTIDVSYTALSNDLSIPVGDGIASDNVVQSDTIFPFFAAP